MSHKPLIEDLRDTAECTIAAERFFTAARISRAADALAECDRELLAAAATADNCELLRRKLDGREAGAVRDMQEIMRQRDVEHEARAAAQMAYSHAAKERDVLRAELERAKRALTQAGYTDHGGEEWKPQIGPSPSLLLTEMKRLRADLTAEKARYSELFATFHEASTELAALREQEPVTWTLRETLETRETTTTGYLWFTNPQNFAWVPLYAAAVPAPAPAVAPVGDERAAFERWYAENAFDYASSPVGSRDCGLQWTAWIARAQLPATVPAGWKLVPVEPTPEMSAYTTTGVAWPIAERIYAAMLAASPKPEGAA